ncbi:MAG TPA: hypothetical protein ENN46_01440 [Candidatus Woesearchaeota archaeon]|nr:hypothetical protein [Candidatus Woesearchaeota archaeon]
MKNYFIIFDKNGELFTLIAKCGASWRLFSGSGEELSEHLSISGLKEKDRFSLGEDSVLLFEANMNIPVKIVGDYSTYLWCTKESALSKLEEPEKAVLTEALSRTA